MRFYKIAENEKKELETMLRQLHRFCQKNSFPMFVSVAVENSEARTGYANLVLSPGANAIPLTDDRIREYILIANGSHEAVMKRDRIEINLEDLMLHGQERGESDGK